VKVVCRTCDSEHKYRHNKSGKQEMTAEQAFQKVLARVTGQVDEPSAGAAKKKRNKSSGIRGFCIRLILALPTLHRFVLSKPGIATGVTDSMRRSDSGHSMATVWLC